MKNLNHLLLLLTGGFLVLHTFAADAPERPLHVLYLGPVNVGSDGRGFGGFGAPRTNYVYLPGQTLAREAIYFDHLTAITNLTDAYLKHFDGVVQVMPDSEVGAVQQKMLESFKSAGNTLVKYGECPTDAFLRDAVLSGISRKTRSAWESFLASARAIETTVGRCAELRAPT